MRAATPAGPGPTFRLCCMYLFGFTTASGWVALVSRDFSRSTTCCLRSDMSVLREMAQYQLRGCGSKKPFLKAPHRRGGPNAMRCRRKRDRATNPIRGEDRSKRDISLGHDHDAEFYTRGGRTVGGSPLKGRYPHVPRERSREP